MTARPSTALSRHYQPNHASGARISEAGSAHSDDRNYAQSLHLVPSSARRPRARRKRAPLHPLHLPLLRARRAKACRQSARREIAPKTIAAVHGSSEPSRFAVCPHAVQLARSVWAARDCTLMAKKSDGGAGRRPRPRVHSHPPALNAHCGSLVYSTYWAWLSSLRVSFHSCKSSRSYDAVPSYEYLGCYF